MRAVKRNHYDHVAITMRTTHHHTHTHALYTVHMALVGYFIVFSFVTKPGQTLEFLLWGTIVPLNSLVGYHCSIVASTPQPMAYASTPPDPHALFPIWWSNGLVLVQDVARYLATIIPHCMNLRTLAGAFTTT